MSYTRKIKNFDGTKPPQSFLIHPVTLKLLEEKNNELKSNQTPLEDFSLPKLDFSLEEILQAYQIKFLDDLENYYSTNDIKSIRLIKIFFQVNQKKIKKINKDQILAVLEIIKLEYPKLSFDKIIDLIEQFLDSNKKWENFF
jgi:hypothetical protein